jgi:hypothetical protein
MAKVTLTWADNSPANNELATDILHGFVHNATRNANISIAPDTARVTEAKEIIFPLGWTSADEIHVYTAFRRLDGLDASDTVHLAFNDN